MLDDIENIAKEMRRKARRIANLRARDDKRALAEDIEQSGWIGFLECKDDHWRWFEANRAMTNCWLRWRFGVQRQWGPAQRKRKEPERLSDILISTVASKEVPVEDTAYIMESLRKIDNLIASKRAADSYSKVFSMLMLHGDASEHLDNGAYIRHGIKGPHYASTKRRLQEIVRISL